MELRNFLFMIISINFASVSFSQINYNDDCYREIRKIGLPRKWKSDFDDHPLATPLHIEEVSVQLEEKTFNKTDTWKSAMVPLLSCLNPDSPQLIRAIRDLYLDENKKKKKPYNLAFTTDQFQRWFLY